LQYCHEVVSVYYVALNIVLLFICFVICDSLLLFFSIPCEACEMFFFQFDSDVKKESSGDTDEKDSIPTAVSLAVAEKFLALELQLCDVLRGIKFPAPVTHIYNPLEYAMEPHKLYVTKYCTTTKHVLFLGINPGPFGMAQTGVKFNNMSCGVV